MNSLEKKMVDILIDLKENHKAIGIKVEFEAEGTRLEETLRIKEIINKVGLDFTIKIGGCEAIKDMRESRLIGVSKIVAPMIESPYALKKFISASRIAFPDEERDEVQFFINIETINAYKQIDEILKTAIELGLNGIVIGRGDLSESMGLYRSEINNQQILDITKDILTKSKHIGLTNGIGGGVCVDSMPFFRTIPKETVDFFETRKVIFNKEAIYDDNAENGILKAIDFELMWLENKHNYYNATSKEDISRINILKSKLNPYI